MIILFIVVIALLAAVLLLRGEGDSYGKGNTFHDNNKRKINFSDKNFFL
ncbi:MAG: hypothetical protein HRT73_14495 [Flavobacteriales bacterium]|nr:hypothetical protein [Flavobacteriales bacterium]NQX99066.1 hypothetical protein [Flavobacteriales bacterium]